MGIAVQRRWREHDSARAFREIVSLVPGAALKLRAAGIVTFEQLVRAREETLRGIFDTFDASKLRRAIAKFTPRSAAHTEKSK